MNIEKTKMYYQKMSSLDICECDYCKNYVLGVKRAYPDLAKYLNELGIEIEKPFETMPLEPDENMNIEYICSQYIVFGDKRDFDEKEIGSVHISISDSHPSTGISEEHFVIEIYPLVLKYGDRNPISFR